MEVWKLVVLIKVIFILDNAHSFPDLITPSETNGTYKASHTISCIYKPSSEHTQEQVTWSTNSRTIIQRDVSGKHIPLAKYRDMVSIPSSPPGDVSLTIKKLMITDQGEYICEVIWKSKITQNNTVGRASVRLNVIPVEVTEPTIIPSGPHHILYVREKLTLTCKSEGSPPITYKWYRDTIVVSRSYLLTFSAVHHSDEGNYFCEVENTIFGKLTKKRSNVLKLVIIDQTTTAISDIGTTESYQRHTTQGTTTKAVHVSESTSSRTRLTTAGTTTKAARVSESTSSPMRLTTAEIEETSSLNVFKGFRYQVPFVVLVLVVTFVLTVIIAVVCWRRQKRKVSTYEAINVSYLNVPNGSETVTCSGEVNGNLYQEIQRKKENDYETMTYAADKHQTCAADKHLQ